MVPVHSGNNADSTRTIFTLVVDKNIDIAKKFGITISTKIVAESSSKWMQSNEGSSLLFEGMNLIHGSTTLPDSTGLPWIPDRLTTLPDLIGLLWISDRLTTLPNSTGLPWILNRLTMVLVSTKMTGEVKLVEKNMSPKGLSMISARKIAAAVPCLLRVSGMPTRKSAELSAVLEEAGVWAGAGVTITRIPVVEKGVSMMIISMVGLITKN